MLANFFKGFMEPDQPDENQAASEIQLSPSPVALADAAIELPLESSTTRSSVNKVELADAQLEGSPLGSDTEFLAKDFPASSAPALPASTSPTSGLPSLGLKQLTRPRSATGQLATGQSEFGKSVAGNSAASIPAAQTHFTQTLTTDRTPVKKPLMQQDVSQQDIALEENTAAQAGTTPEQTTPMGPVGEVEAPLVNSKADERPLTTSNIDVPVNPTEASSLATVAPSSAPVPTIATQSTAVSTTSQQTVATTLRATASNPLHGEAMQVFVRQAKAYMQHQDWEKAIAACEEALAVAPDVAEAHKLIGNILQEMGKGIDSMGHYARALLANPTFPEVFANLGSLYARQKAWEDAELYYRKAIALREDPLFLKPLTKVLEAQGKSEEAMQLFAQRVKLAPEKATAEEHFLAGNFFMDEGDEDQAIANYRHAVELDENFSQAYRPLADLLEKQGDWQTATLYYRKVLQAGLTSEQEAQQSSQDQSVKSTGSGQIQRLPGGQASLQQLLQDAKQVHSSKQSGQSSNDVLAFQERGRALGVEAASQQQAAALEQATKYARSGQLQAQEGNWPRAIEYYKESLSLNPRQPEVYRELARVLTQAKQTDKAAMAWFRSFQLEPDWATAEQHYNLANNLVKQGKLEEGAVCYKQAIRLKPEMATAYENLGRVLELQNDPTGAATAYRKALEVKGAVAVKK